MTVDYNFAHQCYPAGWFRSSVESDKFHAAYLVSNENLRKSVTAFGNQGGDILTVAASGDQAMYYAINGAKRIDTFDMSFCAKVIQDLKTAAVGQLTYRQYLRLLGDLYHVQRGGGNIMSVNSMSQVISAMPKDSADFIQKMPNCNIFGQGVSNGKDLKVYVSPDEYAKMQNIIKGPFNFIWSNITDLHTHLNRQYDVINVSNIFEWLEYPDARMIVPTLKNLYKCLKPNGYIYGVSFNTNSYVDEYFDQAAFDLHRMVCFEPVGLELAMILRKQR